MKRERSFVSLLKALSRFLMLFLLVAFVMTCSTMLFASTLSTELEITLSEDNLGAAAKLTCLNVIFLGVLLSLVDTLRRHYTVSLPARRIAQVTQRIINGDYSARIGISNDIFTDDAFARIAECFNEMASEIGSVEALRSDFIANVSHEMKTPLAVMQSYATLLCSPTLTDEKRLEYANGMIDATRRTSDMMTNVLRLNKLDSHNCSMHTEIFELGEQLCECLLQFESVWEKSHIELDADIDEGIYVCSDAELLKLVWNNLFSNAFKFTDENGKVCVTLKRVGEYAEVRVKDNGCGMSAETGAHIFDKFYQGDTSHAVQGNGLGLALVKKVIDITGGEICVESSLGHGSCFTVRLKAEDERQI